MRPDVTKIKILARDGYSIGDIARHTGLAKSTVARALGLPGTPPDHVDAPLIAQRRTPTTVTRAEVQALTRQGLTPNAIAARLGVHVRTVYRYLDGQR